MALDRDRYQALLGCLLDGAISDAESEELAQMLNSEPELRRDLREHLVLWDLWAQQATLERSATSFLAAWKTRLAAEAGADEFREAVRAKLETVAPRAERRTQAEASEARLVTWMAALRRPAGLAWAAAMAVVVLTGSLWLVLPRSAHATVTIHGEAVCTACVLHQTHDCHPAIRVTSEGATQIYYLDSNQAVAGMQGRFCSGPTPAVATGTTATKDGRRLFAAATVFWPGDQKPRDPQEMDGRVLFPF